MNSIEQWSLKDKNGNPPPPQIVDFIKKLDKKSLLPCPRSADDLQMPEKGTVPREMNNFIVFRRQLAYVAKFQKTSDDGRVISTAASFIWNGASESEKKSYTRIAEELKKRHREKYPNYTYERRKRRTQEEDFIHINADTITQNNNNKSRKKRKPSPDSRSFQHVSEEPKVVPTILPQENSEWLNPLTSQVDNGLCLYECYPSENYHDGQLISDHNIPQVVQALTSINYTQNTVAAQQQLQQILLFQQQEQQISPFSTWDVDTFDSHTFYHGNPDVGINQPSFEGLERPIDELLFRFY